MNLDRARRTAALLADRDIQDAFELIEREIVAAWRGAAAPEAREQHWHEMSALTRLRAKLRSFASDLQKVEARRAGEQSEVGKL